MWISYSGKDSGVLVDALEQHLKNQCPVLELHRYKKRVEIADQLSEIEQSEAGVRADDEWPVEDKAVRGVIAQEQFYLLPMEELFELVIEIACDSQVLVILSPAYFKSLPCLQELAALMCRKGLPLPMFFLNGVTHDEIREGRITTNEAGLTHESIIDLTAALAEARTALSELNAFGFNEELSESAAAEYLQGLAKRNVAEVSVNPTADTGARPTTRYPESHCVDSQSAEAIATAARTIVSAIEEKFVHQTNTQHAHDRLRNADRQRYVGWFEYDLGEKLLEMLKEGNADINAEAIINQLIAEPSEMNRDITSALRKMNQSKLLERDVWNTGISELAGLYALMLIDYDTLAKLANSTGSGLLFIRFFAGEFKTSLRASIVNATLQNSRLRLMPSAHNNSAAELEAPGFSLSEPDIIAGQPGHRVAREFVETLHAYIFQKPPDSCVWDDDSHPTGMSGKERSRIRGRIKRYQREQGHGSLIVIVEKRRFSSGENWWDCWDKVHSALNDGANAHSKVMLQGVVVTENDNVASITMHPEHEERLTYIEDLLTSYYLI